jgi:hypothetical protein
MSRRRLDENVITPQALHLFRLGLKMQHDGVFRDSREYMDMTMALHRELGLRPWHEFIFDIDVDDEPDMVNPIKREHHAHVLSLRRALEELAKEDAT